MLQKLLSKGGERAKEIIASFTPAFESKKAYLDYIDTLASSGDRIEYQDDKAVIKL